MSDTPIYDQLVIDKAITDPEGVALVEAILDRQRDRHVREWDRRVWAPKPERAPKALDTLFPFLGIFRVR